MYLKNIEVQGFKSFAQKINFEFHNGITGIVGPNGSGKSNVGDAVRWVLGEQSARSLRGGNMQDVIFSGTETRKPLGYASVAITLDNSDHKLPVDFNEVTVTRRLYRSGESEYKINGSACRLKDINEMFYDTGIGKEGYSIIGQGQIDRILSGKPEERRELFDEAAGIVKFKRRKNTTIKKLEEERQNLVRVTDILNENPQVDIYRYVTEQTFDAYLYQLVEGKQKFASQIMTSKSPVRSAEDIDETALSYAEIKMLATGNPYIKEKMDLDIQVQKLKMLKSNFLSEKYGLEDKVIKFYPQQIAYLKSRVEGLTKDVETAKSHPKPIDEQPLGMMVSGVSYSEKAEAGQAIINACKSMNNPDAIPLGEYRGFQMELYFDTVQRNYVVKLKGETSRDVPLGDDAHGNIVRIDNGIERFEETLADTKNSLENTEKQFETAKQEIEKPFAKEEELRAKTARLDELNILLNMDKKENEIVGGEPDEGEAVGGRKEKSYER